VLAGYRGSQQDRTLAKLQQLGATVARQALSTGEVVVAEITLGEGWRGTTADLAALKRVPSLQRLSIYAESVNDEAVKHLAPLKHLTRLELFGTNISDNAYDRLTKSLASTTLDRRKGGLLGVQGQPTQGAGCLVSHVQADSAAEKAGLQVGDVIKKFEGKPVDDFDSLTKLIATKGGGEPVEIELERHTQVGEKIEKQTLTKKATLDKWKNRPTLGLPYNENDLQIIIRR
jgi:membrane-associated protease RseP (regulator of RpoE activity)